jgi:hypothetical protein
LRACWAIHGSRLSECDGRWGGRIGRGALPPPSLVSCLQITWSVAVSAVTACCCCRRRIGLAPPVLATPLLGTREREERHLPRTGGRGSRTGCMRRAAVLGLDSADGHGRGHGNWRGRRRDSWRSRQQHVQVDEDAVRDENGERASNHGIRPSPSLPAVNATAIISVHLFFFSGAKFALS